MRQFFRLESRLFLALLTFACLSFALPSTSVAGKVKFPPDDPAFTIELPPGWTSARNKEGNLNCDPPGDSGYAFSVLLLKAVQSGKELKAALPQLANAANLKNFKIGDVEDTESESLRFAEVRGEGKADGETIVVVVTGFEPQKGRFFALLSVASKQADKKHAKDYEAIAASIEPLDSKSKGQNPDVKPPGKEEKAAVDQATSAPEQSGDSQDRSTELSEQYADYLVALSTRSPDGKFAVIYPKAKLCPDERKKGAANRCQDYLVALQPFQILTALDTESPEFENKNHGGMRASWVKDGSAVLVTLDGKWGPNDIFLYEIGDGKLSRSTNLLRKVRDLLVSDCKKALPDRAGDCSAFVFVLEDDAPVCQFAGSSKVRIRVTAKTDPKETPGRKQWDGEAEATWDIPKAEFTSQKVTRKFAGIRKETDS